METTNNYNLQNDSMNPNEIKWGGWLNEFLWICAGVNRQVLRQCPTDYAKYAGIGGTILFTGLMAMLSGGYALFFVFQSVPLAIAFGIFWGLLIFNLDRFIVNTMYSDGKVTISWREFYCGLPRIIMAIFLGVVISTPLELKIFEDAIDIQMEAKKEALVQEGIHQYEVKRDSIAKKRDNLLNGSGIQIFDANITTSSETTNQLLSERKDLDSQLKTVQQNIDNLSEKIKSLSNQLSNLSESTNDYRKISNNIANLKQQRTGKYTDRNNIQRQIQEKTGQIAASDKKLGDLLNAKNNENTSEAIRLKAEVDSLNKIINVANERHKNWDEKTIKTKGSLRDKVEIGYNGFQAKMNAFNTLKEKDNATKICAWFVMMLFIIIETAPTFFKMMIASGPYDDLLRARMYKVKILADKEISDINDEVNTSVEISTQQNKDRLTAEIEANKELLSKIAQAQSDVLSEAIALWREEELKKVRENPSAYIQTSLEEPLNVEQPNKLT